MEEESKKRVRSSLDELIGHDLPDEVPGLDEGIELSPVRDLSRETNNQALTRATTKAKGVKNNLLKFYLSENIIQEQENIKTKNKIKKKGG